MYSVFNFIFEKINPLSRIFPIAINKSLATETDNAQLVTTRTPSYTVEHWEFFGEVPVWKPSNKLMKVKIAAVSYLYSRCARLPWSKSRFKSTEDVENFLLKSYPKNLSIPLMPNESDNSDENLYGQVIANGHYDLLPYGDDSYALDISAMSELPTKAGYGKYGGIAVVSFVTKSILYIINLDNEKIFPGEQRWEFEKFKFRSSLFVFMNTGPHTVLVHAMICPKLYIATHQLNEKHPLKVLLAPFVEGIEKNILRSKVTIYTETGGLKLITGYLNAGIDLAMSRGIENFKIKLLNELHLPEEMRQLLQSFWDPIHELVSTFIKYHKIDEADSETATFKNYLTDHIQSRLGELPLAQTISFCIFCSTISHYLWGHTYNGSMDRSFISSSFSEGFLDLNSNDLFEEMNSTVVRTGVIISINRKVIKMMENFSHLTDDPNVKKMFVNFSEKLQALKGKSGPIDMNMLASSGMM